METSTSNESSLKHSATRISLLAVRSNAAACVDFMLGVYKFTLLVTDASGLSAMDNIIVTVQDTVPSESIYL